MRPLLSHAAALLAAGAALLACAPSAGAQQQERVPRSPGELAALLRSDAPVFQGRIRIPRDADWDMTAFRDLPVRSGVEIVGERGDLGSRPLLHSGYRNVEGEPSYGMFLVEGNDVRIEGLHLRGPMHPGNRRDARIRNRAINVRQVHGAAPGGRRVVIADNEVERWVSGIDVNSPDNLPTMRAYDARCAGGCPHLEPGDAGLVRIERNDIHHNAMDGEGYGVHVGGGAYATIEGNVFDFNRHAVSHNGHAYSGYVARTNYVLQGGYTEGLGYWNQHFDVHGSGEGGYGEGAGSYFSIQGNTVRGEQDYYAVKTRPAFMLRGTPQHAAYLRDNVLAHDDAGEAFRLKSVGQPARLVTQGNRFDTDFSDEIAAGDFDGDGRDDVFVANGTGWFFSRAGIRPWELLRASTERTGDLAFADMDADGRTDVLSRDGGGRIGVHPAGRGERVPLTTSPVAMRDHRFGDFDGDGRTDVFRARRGGRWEVWHRRTGRWSTVNTSDKPVSELLFGRFDGDRTTDVAGVNRSGWAVSAGATRAWAPLNRLRTPFERAVAADFDGNGRTDIAVADGRRWRLSRDGRGPLTTLRAWGSASLHPSLERMAVGRFDGGMRAKAIGFGRVGERLAMWDGPGSGDAFSARSERNMR